MKTEELTELLPESEKLPVGSLVWQIRISPAKSTKTVKIISEKHNTDCYPLHGLPKPISKIIDFTVNDNIEIKKNGSH
ncbi:MAG: hypothetical protein WCM76_05030 [Bacteroidota bacterium]